MREWWCGDDDDDDDAAAAAAAADDDHDDDHDDDGGGGGGGDVDLLNCLSVCRDFNDEIDLAFLISKERQFHSFGPA